MYRTIEEFIQTWKHEGPSTQKIMNALTDESLKQEVAPGHRTLGSLAWHIVTTIHEMLSRTGLEFDAPHHESAAPSSGKEIAEAYERATVSMIAAINEQWTDESLQVIADMYGEKWPNGLTLSILVNHQIHHRGQMTVLMRQAGLMVPGMYGPSLEEWEAFSM